MERLICPKTLARVKDLPLVAKTVADGFLHGLQHSRVRGVGMEFSQYRGYEPGDELSRIDWKLFARSDRYFVREGERESETHVFLLVDATASMARQSQQEGAWSKLDYARTLAATLAYIAQSQGDSVGYLPLSSATEDFIEPGGGAHHWHRILRHLNLLKSGEVFPNPQWLMQYTARLQNPGLVFVISDFYQQNAELLDFVKAISGGHNEVAAIELNCHDELSFPYQGVVRFKDLETGEEVCAPARSLRDNYFNALYQHQVELKSELAACGVQLCSIDIDKPLDEALFHYLKQRNRVGA